MSIHPSLGTSAKNKKTRSVLKRAERLKILMDKGLWKEGQSIFALPKTKVLRLKFKKEKAAPAAVEAPTEAGAAPAAEAATEEATTTEKPKKSEKPTKPSESPSSKESKK
ncbi:MAG: hypothetical protein AMJ78_00095 [Omnitrophica WOR_2 bacterium SM23_29]|nr:MAG: hypothetical protein AMJ78_00095 [Omnitrophica WOR_2 bacterium SM23_29]